MNESWVKYFLTIAKLLRPESDLITKLDGVLIRVRVDDDLMFMRFDYNDKHMMTSMDITSFGLSQYYTEEIYISYILKRYKIFMDECQLGD